MNFLNYYENKFLKNIKSEKKFKDFYDEKDIFQRARIQLNSIRIFEENERKELLNRDKKKKLNKSCSANLIKVPHITTFQRFQLLKEENTNVIKRRSMYNNIDSLKPKKIDYYFQIKLINKKTRNSIKEYKSILNNNESKNKKNKNHLLILYGNKIDYINNNSSIENKINNNNNESFDNTSHSQLNRNLNRINLMKPFLKSSNNIFPQKKINLKKIILNNIEKKNDKSYNKVKNPILKNFPIIQNIYK